MCSMQWAWQRGEALGREMSTVLLKNSSDVALRSCFCAMQRKASSLLPGAVALVKGLQRVGDEA